MAAIQGAQFPNVDLNEAMRKICGEVRTLQDEVRKQKEQVRDHLEILVGEKWLGNGWDFLSLQHLKP